ncbi:MAG: hypothetical protein IME93_02195 [Proteobacteria bacterium]|nr:hypothetical protein [Pseudomonadota bacterium]
MNSQTRKDNLKQELVCYWPTVLLCLRDCDHSLLSAALPDIRKRLGVSVWPAPHQANGRDVFIDITHWQAPLGGAYAAAWALLDQLKQTMPEMTWYGGIAPGLASARFAAQTAEPGGLIDIPAWKMADVMAYVPLLECMDSVPSMLRKRLTKDGIHYCGDVLQFKASEWSRCYGESAISLRRACLGLDYLEVNKAGATVAACGKSNLLAGDNQELSHTLMLPANASSHRALQSYLRVMCVRLSRKLKRCAQRTGRVELELWSAGPSPVWAFGVGLGLPDNDAGNLFTVLQAGLRQSLESAPVSHMRITASRLSHEAGQLDMLDQLLAGQNTQNSVTPNIRR